MKALKATGFRAFLWHQGESDSIADTKADVYAATLNRIITASRVEAGVELPWLVAIVSYHPDSEKAREREVIKGQKAVIDADSLVFKGAQTDDFHKLGYLSDKVHFNDKGLREHANRRYNVIYNSILRSNR